jgi:hypothetical protein
MDAIKVAKVCCLVSVQSDGNLTTNINRDWTVWQVERVQCNKPTLQGDGTLHLTAHHLIFIYDGDTSEKEMWVSVRLDSETPSH